MKRLVVKVKPYLKWFILGATAFFLVKTFKDRFAEITHISLTTQGFLMLGIALACTLFAHIWSGWVWSWILILFQQSLGWGKALQVYLITNIAKYLPGNVWHFYGRISAIKDQGASTGIATFCVVLEPLLMAAAALLVALICTVLGFLEAQSLWMLIIQVVVLGGVLLGIHPLFLNPVLQRLGKSKAKTGSLAPEVQLQTYPLIPFLGEIGFVLLRGLGFLLVFMAIQAVEPRQIPTILSVFSFAWLLGLVVPGAPGGVGVFEATAVALLPSDVFPGANVIVVVALYRVISVLAEAIAALGAWLYQLANPGSVSRYDR